MWLLVFFSRELLVTRQDKNVELYHQSEFNSRDFERHWLFQKYIPAGDFRGS